MHKIIVTSFLFMVVYSTIALTGYSTAKNMQDFDAFISENVYTVVAFYKDSPQMAMTENEAAQLKQFRTVFKQVSNDPAYNSLGFIAVNVIPSTDGMAIKQRYEVTGYPSYIILKHQRQVSPSPFRFFKIGEGYLSDNVSKKQLEDFINQTVK